MKQAVVPAQITTVEDKIASNLTLQQLFILSLPVFIDLAVFLIVPRELHLNPYKLAVMLVVLTTCWTAAIRVKGRLLLHWAITIISYNHRPRYHVFNKNDNHLREMSLPLVNDEAQLTKPKPTQQTRGASFIEVSDEDKLKLETLSTDPKLGLSFMSHKKGGLRVYITQSKH